MQSPTALVLDISGLIKKWVLSKELDPLITIFPFPIFVQHFLSVPLNWHDYETILCDEIEENYISPEIIDKVDMSNIIDLAQGFISDFYDLVYQTLALNKLDSNHNYRFMTWINSTSLALMKEDKFENMIYNAPVELIDKLDNTYDVFKDK